MVAARCVVAYRDGSRPGVGYAWGGGVMSPSFSADCPVAEVVFGLVNLRSAHVQGPGTSRRPGRRWAGAGTAAG